MNIEVIDRALGGNMVGFKGIKYFSMMGYSTIYMGVLAGLLTLIIELLTESNKYMKLKTYQEVLIGGFLITLAEFICGCILNLWLHLNIWDYQGEFCNILGQIELKNTILWFLLIPIILWLDSHITYYLYNEGQPLKLLQLYKELFTLR